MKKRAPGDFIMELFANLKDHKIQPLVSTKLFLRNSSIVYSHDHIKQDNKEGQGFEDEEEQKD